PRNLTIITAPYKPSHLDIPPSLISPRFPIAKTAPPPHQKLPYERSGTQTAFFSLHLLENIRWPWQGHICNWIYRLSVTGQTLDDGYFFC
ncbi:hypothetical protein M433DRAFT_45014, partial [Acidomyces richmondensis BFW]